MEITHEIGLVRPYECDAILECIGEIGTPSGHSDMDQGVLYYGHELIENSSYFVYGLLADISERVRVVAEKVSGLELAGSQLAIFKTIPGHTPEEHADSQNMDGTPKDGCSDFAVSAVVYFNDNFIGGQLVFPKLAYSYQPIAGSCILFPSTISHSHYVAKVDKGERIVLPLWFSHIV